MKNKLTKYRGVVVIATSLIFNLVTSLLVWHPEGKMFNVHPMTVTEWICDIIGITWFFTGFLMALYDANKDSKNQMEEAFKKGADMLREVGIEFKVEEK